MTIVKDSSSAPDPDEDELEKQVNERNALSEATCKQVCVVQHISKKNELVESYDCKIAILITKFLSQVATADFCRLLWETCLMRNLTLWAPWDLPKMF